ncbi:MAG: hypothetical protein JXA93_04670 [Anaerolineae bacterium]|nr:hypothetical protein [Anaerolineae bacterium]
MSDTTRYLFAGDSLTEGMYGASYVDLVAAGLAPGKGQAAEPRPVGEDIRVINAGRSGETVASLRSRLGGLLERYNPDWVVLAVGCNDVWLPWLARHSLGWRLWSGYRGLAAGMRATVDLDRFGAAYRDLVDQARGAGAQVLACTVSPVGERLSSPVNAQVARLNGTIKHVAAGRRVAVADVWQACVEVLAAAPYRSAYLPGEWLFAWLDRKRYRAEAVERTAERRRLHLTFDGVHLNNRGAEVWARTVLDALAAAHRAAEGKRPALAGQLDLPFFQMGALPVCHSPGWSARAHDVAQDLALAYDHLAELTGTCPSLSLALLNRAHWEQSACPVAYPSPYGEWNGQAGILYMPDAYDDSFLRDWHVPAAVAAWTAWPPALSMVEAPARATALADLLALEDLSRLFLHDLQVAPADPALAQLLAAYLVQVVLYGKHSGGARIAGVWNAWGELLARAGVDAGHRRVRAHTLYNQHGPDLVAALAGNLPSLAKQVTTV